MKKVIFLIIICALTLSANSQSITDNTITFDAAAPDRPAKFLQNITYDYGVPTSYSVAIITPTSYRHKTDSVDFTGTDTILMNPGALSTDYVRGLNDSFAVFRALITDPGARLSSTQSFESSTEGIVVVPTWSASTLLTAFVISILLSVKLLLKGKKGTGED